MRLKLAAPALEGRQSRCGSYASPVDAGCGQVHPESTAIELTRHRPSAGLLLSLALLLACGDVTGPGAGLRPIVFTQMLPAWRIYRVRLDGTPPQRIPFPGQLVHPAVSHDGQTIAYVNDSVGGGLFVQPLDSGPPRRVYPDTLIDHLDWSPAGDQLVMALRWAGAGPNSGGLRIVKLADGTTRDIAADLSDPAWSPDGRTILAAWGQSPLGKRAPGIYSVTVGDTTARLVIAGRPGARTPAWSPDGTRVAVALGSNGASFIYTMRLDGSDAVQLTRAAPFEYLTDLSPVWAPDGSGIAFQREHTVVLNGARVDRYDIYVVSLDGSGLRNLTETATWGGLGPTW